MPELSPRQVDLAVNIAVGPKWLTQTADTLDSIEHYLAAECDIAVVVVDDSGEDDTAAMLQQRSGKRFVVLRREKPFMFKRNIHATCLGYDYVVKHFQPKLVMKIDTDALITGYGLFRDAIEFHMQNPNVGIFGKHLTNPDGSIKSYKMHTDLLAGELHPSNLRGRVKLMIGRGPWYLPIVRRAQRNGWGLGENVFGGGYFMTPDCLSALSANGYLTPSNEKWHGRLQVEDVYFTMCAVASGFSPGHFAAPWGPLAMLWQSLPFPAREIHERGYKFIHSVDKGRNTSREENNGLTVREYFKKVREAEATDGRVPQVSILRAGSQSPAIRPRSPSPSCPPAKGV